LALSLPCLDFRLRKRELLAVGRGCEGPSDDETLRRQICRSADGRKESRRSDCSNVKDIKAEGPVMLNRSHVRS
jgi:hypothetical protein